MGAFLLVVTLAGFGTLEIPTVNCKAAIMSLSGAVFVQSTGERLPLAGMVTGVKCIARPSR